jgi:hypothetical protein
MWPDYDVGSKIRIQHPESPIPGKQIELTTLSHSPRLILIDNFLSDEEVDHLVDRARSRLEQSVTGANADGTHAHRTSKNAWESTTPIARRLIYRAFSLARVPCVFYFVLSCRVFVFCYCLFALWASVRLSVCVRACWHAGVQ